MHVGDVAVGSDHPIRVQSMTTPATTNTRATVEQIERLVGAGCEIVRVTVPTSADADNLPNIRGELARRKIRVPLVADIHFTPAAAMRAVEHVDKIRVNPGNYADKKKFAVRAYTDQEYEREIERIARVFSPLVLRAQSLGVSMRIGTNHGSLSDRIMNRFGDTPEGMVESALEFVRICESHGYRELILSMKASNPVVVLAAYRLLAERMSEASMDYPLHLGVTEAGDGEDGRVKSAIGIGALLDEGIGDTVRVSLTEDPVREIPVALALVAPYNRAGALQASADPPRAASLAWPLRAGHERRQSTELSVGPHRLGGAHTVLVEVPLHGALADAAGLKAAIDGQAGVRVPEETRAEVVSVDVREGAEIDALERLRQSIELVAPRVALSARVEIGALDSAPLERWILAAHRLHVAAPVHHPALAKTIERLLEHARSGSRSVLLELLGDPWAAAELGAGLTQGLGPGAPLMLAVSPRPAGSPLHAYRMLVAALANVGSTAPLVLVDDPSSPGVDPLLQPAASLGGLLCDGIGDAIQLRLDDPTTSRRLAFGILQGARVRITRTEFISCPSCGRTLFDLEDTTARIKQRTAHLKGLKIAVMGCVVNGPGEMADADFGYVGWGEDKIALFVGREMVAKDIPTAEADERLVELIKAHGRWVDPPVLAGAS